MNVKNFVFKHIEKIALGITICYLIYTAVHTFMILNLEVRRTDTKLLSLSSAIERKLKTSTPPAIDTELKHAEQLMSRLTLPSPASPLQRPQIFSKFTKEKADSDITTKGLLKKPESQTAARSEDFIPGEIEFVFKGGTADMALVQVRKLYKDKWWTESFTLERGETIGEKKTMGKETVDFDTHCRLMEIVPLAQKPLVMRKTTVVKNEKGEFLGSSFTSETHMISASRITFEYKRGESYNLWIGELAKVGTNTVTVNPSTSVSSTN